MLAQIFVFAPDLSCRLEAGSGEAKSIGVTDGTGSKIRMTSNNFAIGGIGKAKTQPVGEICSLERMLWRRIKVGPCRAGRR